MSVSFTVLAVNETDNVFYTRMLPVVDPGPEWKHDVAGPCHGPSEIIGSPRPMPPPRVAQVEVTGPVHCCPPLTWARTYDRLWLKLPPSAGRVVLELPELLRAAAGDGDLGGPLECRLSRGQLENGVAAVGHRVAWVRALGDGAALVPSRLWLRHPTTIRRYPSNRCETRGHARRLHVTPVGLVAYGAVPTRLGTIICAPVESQA